MAKTYKWGIIGLGKIAHKFAEDLNVAKRSKLWAVASRSKERATAFANTYQAPNAYGSYQEILQCSQLDAIYIATPHISHCLNTLMCLEHQIPVLCEKPFAMNANEVRRMISLAKFQNTFLMEALWTRFLPTTLKVMDLINKGTIGKVMSLQADFGFNATFNPDSRLFNQNLGGGALLDVGIYPVFLSLLLFGKPDHISATAHIGPTNVDESLGILFKYQEKQMAVLQASIITKTATEAVICGEKGIIRINSRWHEPTSLSLELHGKPAKDFFFDYTSNGYHYEIEEVVKCLDKGQKESKLMPLDFSLDLIELLDAIRIKAGIFYPQHDQFDEPVNVRSDDRFSMN